MNTLCMASLSVVGIRIFFNVTRVPHFYGEPDFFFQMARFFITSILVIPSVNVTGVPFVSNIKMPLSTRVWNYIGVQDCMCRFPFRKIWSCQFCRPFMFIRFIVVERCVHC